MICRHLGDLTGPVVDLGCGPGHLTGYLHDLGVEVRGIDPVPEFISHAKITYPAACFEVGSSDSFSASHPALSGILCWYSLIHVAPMAMADVLADLRSATATGGVLLVGFFEGDEVARFDHKVFTAYRWPVEEFSRLLQAAGFLELEHLQRARDGDSRPHAAIAARAISGHD
jgi:trans-aconitate methyltransferase